jgi:uncharacterized protein YndB with AHSA1/START domain
MTGASGDPREGRLERAGDRWRLRFVCVLPHAPEKVWRALTDEAHLASWFPTTIGGELRAGAPLVFRFRGAELPPTRGEMVECEPPRVLEFTWGFGEDDADVPLEYRSEQPERSRFELEPEGEGCRLTFTTTYDRVGTSARDAAGWHVCFDALEDHLAGRPPADAGAERWKPLNRRYAELFGPDAATIGPPDGMAEYVD